MSATSSVEMPQIAERGLTSQEVERRVESGQSNRMKDSTSRSLADIIRANVFTLFNGIIFAAMVLVLITGSWKDAVFGFVIIINTGIGVITELKAKRTLDRLSILVASDYLVHRDGKDVAVPHDEIVLSDLLWIRSGEQVPADGEIVHTWGLELDESMLTGESRTVRHRDGEQVYSGAAAVSGMALVRVNAVGEHSYAATITAQAKVYKKTVSDLNKGINTILKFMTFLVVPLCVLLIFSQVNTVGGWSAAIATGEWRDAVVSAVAGVVGMIPEGLVLLTSLNFALAAIRLARKNTLVQELESVETLARVDSLNLDKTGTITDGGIVFDRILMLDEWDAHVDGSDRANDSNGCVDRDGSDLMPSIGAGDADLAGDVAASLEPSDGNAPAWRKQVVQALYDCCNEESPNGTGRAVLAGLGAQGYAAGSVAARVPFSSARKWSAVLYTAAHAVSAVANEGDHDCSAFTEGGASPAMLGKGEAVMAASCPKPGIGGIWYMGAPEVILAALDGDYASVLNRVNEYADDGYRVLLVAHASRCAVDRANSGVADATAFAEDPVLNPAAEPVALVLCAEQVRADAEATLAWFREQGVRCRVISGANPVTVGAIARRVNLTGDREPVAMDARDLPKDLDELARVLENVDVLGRVLPNQKKAIVQALHQGNHVVAMTGDGVNDALAIKEADLGIAMGNAASATKAVAQVVLVDSKFSHLPDVVARGRQVMANMERVASLFLVKTVYSALISLGVVLTAIPYPYLPRHITYIGALTIGVPAFILALAPNTRRYMPGFLKRVVKFALPGGIATSLSVLLAAWILPGLMGWNVTGNETDLASQRATSAIILFVMGIFVLARVARPLNGWRGGLVIAFAAAGVIGLMIPFVRSFFALLVPAGPVLVATAIALVGSVAIFALCLWLVPRIGHAFAQLLRRHGFSI